MKKKILLVLSILFGLMFINSGLNKFFNYIPAPADMPEKAMKMMTAMMGMVWLMPLLATAEIVGGTLFMITKTRALGAIIIFPVMIVDLTAIDSLRDYPFYGARASPPNVTHFVFVL